MASTYIEACQAFACQDHTGKIFFLLRERTYESNLYPHTPRWGNWVFGSYATCMRNIIRSASLFEGGTNKGCASSPSAFIKQWREKLANPGVLNNSLLTTKFSESLVGLPLPMKEWAHVLCKKYNLPESAIQNDKLTLDTSMEGACSFLEELLEADGKPGFGAWRMNGWDTSFSASKAAVPVPDPMNIPLNIKVFWLPEAYDTPSEQRSHLIVTPEGIRSTRWEYSTIESFIQNEVVALERAYPGSAAPAIRQFRKILKQKCELPKDYVAHITKPAVTSRSYSDYARLIEWSQTQDASTPGSNQSSFYLNLHLDNRGLTREMLYLLEKLISYDLVRFEKREPESSPKAVSAEAA